MNPQPIKDFLLAEWVKKQVEKEDMIKWARTPTPQRFLTWEQVTKDYNKVERSRIIVFLKSVMP